MMKNTVEEIMLKRAFKKLQLAENIIESGKLSESEEKTLDTNSLLDIVKFGIYDVIHDDYTDQDLLDLDIEKILSEGEIKAASQEEEEIKEEEEISEDMYNFEGTDYKQKKSKKEKDEEEFKRLTDVDTLITPLPKRKPISKPKASEDEERPKKKKKTVSNYISTNILIPDMEDEFFDTEEVKEVPLNFVIGDVTKADFGKAPKFIIKYIFSF
jgi:hypothetical protein